MHQNNGQDASTEKPAKLSRSKMRELIEAMQQEGSDESDATPRIQRVNKMREGKRLPGFVRERLRGKSKHKNSRSKNRQKNKPSLLADLSAQH